MITRTINFNLIQLRIDSEYFYKGVEWGSFGYQSLFPMDSYFSLVPSVGLCVLVCIWCISVILWLFMDARPMTYSTLADKGTQTERRYPLDIVYGALVEPTSVPHIHTTKYFIYCLNDPSHLNTPKMLLNKPGEVATMQVGNSIRNGVIRTILRRDHIGSDLRYVGVKGNLYRELENRYGITSGGQPVNFDGVKIYITKSDSHISRI